MIYGFLTSDPEDGENCVLDLKNTLKEVIKKNIDTTAPGIFVKSKKFKSVDEVKTDHHDYYPEIEPFLWNTKLFEEIPKKKVLETCKKLNIQLQLNYYK